MDKEQRQATRRQMALLKGVRRQMPFFHEKTFFGEHFLAISC
jgi:hypothetical protein